MANKAVEIFLRARDAASEVISKVSGHVRALGSKSSEAKAPVEDLGNAESDAAQKGHGLSNSLGRVTSRLTAFIAAGFGLVKLKQLLVSLFNTGGKFEQLAVQIESVMGSLEGGQQATEWVKDFTKRVPYQLEGVTDAFVKLKAFGLDPMDGTMQALVDQASKLGGGQDRLRGIVLAVGQAWAKQKLQGEEILQLVERGVPVWDLLAEATGKNVQQLQDLSEKGKLGRTEIKLLIDEIGKGAKGAAAKNMSILTGLVSNLRDEISVFLNDIAEQGVLDYFKTQLSDLINTIKRLRESGDLQRFAKSVSDNIVTMASVLRSAVETTIRFSSELKGLAIGFAALKIGSMLQNMTKFIAVTIAAAKATRVLTAALAASGWGAVVLGIGFVIEKLLELKRLQESQAAAERRLAKARQETADVYKELSKRIGITIRNSKELIRLEQQGVITYDKRNKQYERTNVLLERQAAEQKAYADAMQTTEEKLGRLNGVQNETARNAIEFGQAWAKLKEETDGLEKSLGKLSDQDFTKLNQQLQDALNTGYVDGADAVEAHNALMAESFKRLNVDVEKFESGMTTAGLQAVTALETISQAAQSTQEQVAEAFKAATAQVGTETGIDALREKLLKLGEDGKLSAEQVAEGMVLLDDRIIEINQGMTAVSKVAVDSFKKISRQAKVTGAEISQAIDSALDGVDTKRGLEALREELDRLHKQGKISLQQLDQEMAKVEQAAKNIGDAVDVAKNKLDELSSSADSAKTVDELNNIGIAAAEAWQEGTISAEQYLEAMAAIDEKKKEILNTIDEQIKKEQELASASEKSAEAQHGHMRKTHKLRGASIQLTRQEADALKKATDDVNASLRDHVIKGIKAYRRYAKTIAGLRDRYLEASQRANQLAAGAENAALSHQAAEKDLRAYSHSLEQAIRHGEKLDGQTLSRLQGALSAVKSKMQQIQQEAQSAKGELSGLESELAGLEGNQRKVQQLQFEQRQADLIAKKAEAEAQGNKDAAQAYERSLALLTKINQVKQKNIRESEKEARLNKQPADQGGSQSSSTLNTPGRTVRMVFETPQGDQAEVIASEGDADKVVTMLQRNKGVTAR